MPNSNTQTSQFKQLSKAYRELLRLRAKVAKLTGEEVSGRKVHKPRNKGRKKIR